MHKMTLDDFMPAAKAIAVMNPYARGRDPESMARWAMEHTRKIDHPSYWECLGFHVTTYRPEFDPENLHVKVAVSAYTAAEFVKEKEQSQ